MSAQSKIAEAKRIIAEQTKVIREMERAEKPWSKNRILDAIHNDIVDACPDLLPCPCCGGRSLLDLGSNNPWNVCIRCLNCGIGSTYWRRNHEQKEPTINDFIRAKPGKPDLTKAIAYAAKAWEEWNRRGVPSP